MNNLMSQSSIQPVHNYVDLKILKIMVKALLTPYAHQGVVIDI